MVKVRTSVGKLVVSADGDGVVSRAGSALLVGVADKIGLTGALSGGDEADPGACLGA